jgi:SAM-dependent methyltransferase
VVPPESIQGAISQEDYARLWDIEAEGGYPANHFAFRHVLATLAEQGASTMLEVGVGGGRALPIFTGAGLEIHGLDNNPDMVEQSRRAMGELGLPSDRVSWGDIEDSVSLAGVRRRGGFDAVLAMGVLPHVTHDLVAAENLFTLVASGGTVFVECRNKLFSLITFNRFTYDFIMDDLLNDVSPGMRATTSEFLRERVDTEIPPRPSGHEARYHNPLTVADVFEEAGFVDVLIRPFRYHSTIPRFEKPLGTEFRSESIILENETSGWRDLFLCSAFLVVARRPEAVNQEVITSD